MWGLKKSFTLIELLIVLTLTLLVCSLAIPHFIGDSRQALYHDLDKLSVIFAYMQQRALASNQEQQLFFDIKNNSYFFINNGKTTVFSLSPKIIFGYLPGSFGPPASPVSPITNPITFSIDKKGAIFVQFNPNGNIKPGSLYIIDKQKNSMGALTCSVSQVSYVRQYTYKASGRLWLPRIAR